MNISINLARAKHECAIAQMFGKPNGSVSIAKMKTFSIASRHAAKIPATAFDQMESKQETERMTGIFLDALKR